MRTLNTRTTTRTYCNLKGKEERRQEIKIEIEDLQASILQRRASSIAGQKRVEEITKNINEALMDQERNLDNLKRLSLAK